MKKETKHPDIIEVEEKQTPVYKQPKARKVRAPETEEERQLWLARYAEKREIEAYREIHAPERRRIQAAALWRMYRDGELVRQTIEIGSLKQEMLYSHESIYAI